MASECSSGEIRVLPHRVDRFNGVTLKVQTSDFDSEALFRKCLQHSLASWGRSGRRGVWVTVPIDASHLVPGLVEEGFTYHHADVDHAVLTKWLPDEAEDSNKLPNPASHYVGVGGLVINARNELLVVAERYAFDSKTRWKLPGGLVDPGEEIADAACREVFEETGIKAEFDSLVCIRHNTKFMFGKSDMYIVARLTPVTENITIDPDEIAAAKWMPVDEFLANKDVYELNRRAVEVAVVQISTEPRLALAQETVTMPFGTRSLQFRLFKPACRGAAARPAAAATRKAEPPSTQGSRWPQSITWFGAGVVATLAIGAAVLHGRGHLFGSKL